jgi:tetratricopeptide (TPR) repeat protein
MHLPRTISAVAILVSIGVVQPAFAQSMTVIGGNSSARECYMAATLAAQMNVASQQEINTCTFALQHGQLSLRDAMATYVNRGVLHAALEQYERAEQDYATAVAMNPSSGEVFVNRGNVHFARQHFDKAVEEYSQALELGLSKDHIAHYNRAMALERLGILDRAEEDYRRAAELVPDWFQPQARLDRLQRQARQQTDGR